MAATPSAPPPRTYVEGAVQWACSCCSALIPLYFSTWKMVRSPPHAAFLQLRTVKCLIPIACCRVVSCTASRHFRASSREIHGTPFSLFLPCGGQSTCPPSCFTRAFDELRGDSWRCPAGKFLASVPGTECVQHSRAALWSSVGCWPMAVLPLKATGGKHGNRRCLSRGMPGSVVSPILPLVELQCVPALCERYSPRPLHAPQCAGKLRRGKQMLAAASGRPVFFLSPPDACRGRGPPVGGLIHLCSSSIHQRPTRRWDVR